MTKLNKLGMYVLVLTGCLFTAFVHVQAASADKQLQKGIEAYQKADNDKALDYFIDVLMNGDNEQVATANKYIDAIHNQIGGIKNPVEVDISFPDQPTQTIIDRTDNLANYGTEKLNTLATNSEQVAQEMAEALNTPKTLTEQIEERQLAGYVQNGVTPVPVEKSALLDDATVAAEQAVNGAATTQQDLKAVTREFTEEMQAQMQPTTTSYAVPAGTGCCFGICGFNRAGLYSGPQSLHYPKITKYDRWGDCRVIKR